jgi:hypothetical protein
MHAGCDEDERARHCSSQVAKSSCKARPASVSMLCAMSRHFAMHRLVQAVAG